MNLTYTYNKKIKKDDFGDIFKIAFDENPPEFSFSNDTTCSFLAKHLTIPGELIEGECDIDVENKEAIYYTEEGNNTELGRYLFEFRFTDGTYEQTYPKTETLNYEVVESI